MRLTILDGSHGRLAEMVERLKIPYDPVLNLVLLIFDLREPTG